MFIIRLTGELGAKGAAGPSLRVEVVCAFFVGTPPGKGVRVRRYDMSRDRAGQQAELSRRAFLAGTGGALAGAAAVGFAGKAEAGEPKPGLFPTPLKTWHRSIFSGAPQLEYTFSGRCTKISIINPATALDQQGTGIGLSEIR